MQITLVCPSCAYQSDLFSMLRDNEQREFLKKILKVPGAQIQLLTRYLAMFKPLKNTQSFHALNSRLDELLALISTGRVKRNHCTHGAPMNLWFAAMQHLLDNTPDGLNLPLKSHNYLASIVFSNAEKAAAKKEDEVIQTQQNRTQEEPIEPHQVVDRTKISVQIAQAQKHLKG